MDVNQLNYTHSTIKPNILAKKTYENDIFSNETSVLRVLCLKINKIVLDKNCSFSFSNDKTYQLCFKFIYGKSFVCDIRLSDIISDTEIKVSPIIHIKYLYVLSKTNSNYATITLKNVQKRNSKEILFKTTIDLGFLIQRRFTGEHKIFGVGDQKNIAIGKIYFDDLQNLSVQLAKLKLQEKDKAICNMHTMVDPKEEFDNNAYMSSSSDMTSEEIEAHNFDNPVTTPTFSTRKQMAKKVKQKTTVYQNTESLIADGSNLQICIDSVMSNHISDSLYSIVPGAKFAQSIDSEQFKELFAHLKESLITKFNKYTSRSDLESIQDNIEPKSINLEILVIIGSTKYLIAVLGYLLKVCSGIIFDVKPMLELHYIPSIKNVSSDQFLEKLTSNIEYSGNEFSFWNSLMMNKVIEKDELSTSLQSYFVQNHLVSTLPIGQATIRFADSKKNCQIDLFFNFEILPIDHDSGNDDLVNDKHESSNANISVSCWVVKDSNEYNNMESLESGAEKKMVKKQISWIKGSINEESSKAIVSTLSVTILKKDKKSKVFQSKKVHPSNFEFKKTIKVVCDAAKQETFTVFIDGTEFQKCSYVQILSVSSHFMKKIALNM